MNGFIVERLFDFMSWLSLRALHRLANLLGWLTYHLSPTYARRMRENLGFYNVGRHPDEFKRLLYANIAETGKGVTELPWVWRRPVADVLSKVRNCYGGEYFEAARNEDKGLIVLTPHIGCFEIIGLFVSSRMPMTCMYSVPRRPWMDRIIRGGRERGQMKLAPADLGGVRILLKALKRGEAIGLLPDQVPSHGEGEWAEFFGRPAYTMTLAGRLLQSTGARVLLSYVVRRPHGEGYDIHFSPLELKPGISVPQQVNSALEKIIRTCPAQYLWSYNRYKVPSGVMPAAEIKE